MPQHLRPVVAVVFTAVRPEDRVRWHAHLETKPLAAWWLKEDERVMLEYSWCQDQGGSGHDEQQTRYFCVEDRRGDELLLRAGNDCLAMRLIRPQYVDLNAMD